ncbi:hypothetical protein [Stenotrophomonas sp.]|uniref:hypothetical protein n=1 Tax=Stenotrophomonas sp. TaxID=69392 RepID=UPI0028A1F2E3|nr:hypothetical protein [Stenotrophomonas sp.]
MPMLIPLPMTVTVPLPVRVTVPLPVRVPVRVTVTVTVAATATATATATVESSLLDCSANSSRASSTLRRTASRHRSARASRIIAASFDPGIAQHHSIVRSAIAAASRHRPARCQASFGWSATTACPAAPHPPCRQEC